MDQKIETLYAWITTDKNGQDGIPAQLIKDCWFPMVGSSLERMESLRPVVLKMLDDGMAVRLVRFDNVTILEQYEPEEKSQ